MKFAAPPVRALAGPGHDGGVGEYATNGGQGGAAGSVTATIDGAMTVTGVANVGLDASTGIGVLAQSFGGQGGRGGNPDAPLGGSGGGGHGASGGTVTIQGTGSITTQGASEAPGMLAQSIGGGIGGASMAETSVQSQDTDPPVPNLSLSVAVGGSGGSGGKGGDVWLGNSGFVMTGGEGASSLVAQSISGGGGAGGDSKAQSTINGDAEFEMATSLAFGGSGGNAGSGGTSNVTNSGGVLTLGDGGYGMFAQSIGGGGGKGGGAAATQNGGTLGFTMKTGGAGGNAGDGGDITATNAGSIATFGADAAGIMAQSIGGSGGDGGKAGSTLGGKKSTGTGGNGSSQTGLASELNLGLGDLTSGSGIDPNASASALTQKKDLNSLLTMGFSLIGEDDTGTGDAASDLESLGEDSGDADAGGSSVGVIDVTNTGTIGTVGQSSGGIFAPSIGGGGGKAGAAFSSTNSGDANLALGVGGDGGAAGDGGAVNVRNTGGSITTTGAMADGIIAQSVGGGGGYVMSGSTVYDGSAGGTGTGGAVTVSLGMDGSAVAVSAAGDSAAGVWLQSQAAGGIGSTGALTLNVGAKASVMGGTDWMGYGLILDGGTANVVSNAGTIGSASNQAILENTPASNTTITNTTVTNTGAIVGDQRFANAAEKRNLEGGTIVTHRALDLGGGALTNAGEVVVGVGARPRTTRMDGDLVQSARGRLRFDADFVGGTADRLAIRGDARLAGGLVVVPATLVPGRVAVLTATGTLDAAALRDATGSPVFHFTPSASEDGTLGVTSSADFTPGGLSADQGSLGTHLRRIWDGEHPESMAKGFAALAEIDDPDAYAATLDRLASRQVGAIATARMESSRAFVQNMQSCPVFEGSGQMLGETDCAWGRAVTAHLDHDGTGAFDTDGTMLEFGGQRRFTDETFIAGAVAWEHSSLSDDSGASADGDAWMAGLGVKYLAGPLLASATLDLGYGQFDTARGFTVGDEAFRATGSPEARNAGLHARVAYELPQAGFYLRPSLDLDASWLHLGGYGESGAGDFDLSVDDRDGWVFSATPAMEIGTRVDLSGGTVLRPFAAAGLRFASGNDWTVNARFDGAPDEAGTFASEVDNPGTVATAGAGVTVMTRGNLDLTAQYQGGFADDFTAQSGAIKATWRF